MPKINSNKAKANPGLLDCTSVFFFYLENSPLSQAPSVPVPKALTVGKTHSSMQTFNFTSPKLNVRSILNPYFVRDRGVHLSQF